MTVSVRAPAAQEKPHVLGDARRALPLFRRVFASGPLESSDTAEGLERECPLVFDGAFGGAVIALEADGEIVSACAVLRRDLVVGGQCVRAGFIGSVATDPRFRGRGLASRVLEAAEAELRDRGAWIACLWADDAPFYEQRGWRQFGAELDVVVSPALAPELPEASGVRPLARGDVAAVHALYCRHSTRVERTLSETSVLLACPRMSVLVRERAGAVVAYACMGRGRDFGDAIHEWGGEAEDVSALVRAHLERRLALGERGNVYLIAPADERSLVARLEEAGASASTGILGLAKVVDARVAAEFALSQLGARERVAAHLDHRLSENRIEFTSPRGTCTLSQEELVDVLFCARGDRRASSACAKGLGLDACDLPLAPFAWGLDSI